MKKDTTTDGFTKAIVAILGKQSKDSLYNQLMFEANTAIKEILDAAPIRNCIILAFLKHIRQVEEEINQKVRGSADKSYEAINNLRSLEAKSKQLLEIIQETERLIRSAINSSEDKLQQQLAITQEAEKLTESVINSSEDKSQQQPAITQEAEKLTESVIDSSEDKSQQQLEIIQETEELMKNATNTFEVESKQQLATIQETEKLIKSALNSLCSNYGYEQACPKIDESGYIIPFSKIINYLFDHFLKNIIEKHELLDAIKEHLSEHVDILINEAVIEKYLTNKAKKDDIQPDVIKKQSEKLQYLLYLIQEESSGEDRLTDCEDLTFEDPQLKKLKLPIQFDLNIIKSLARLIGISEDKVNTTVDTMSTEELFKVIMRSIHRDIRRDIDHGIAIGGLLKKDEYEVLKAINSDEVNPAIIDLSRISNTDIIRFYRSVTLSHKQVAANRSFIGSVAHYALSNLQEINKNNKSLSSLNKMLDDVLQEDCPLSQSDQRQMYSNIGFALSKMSDYDYSLLICNLATDLYAQVANLSQMRNTILTNLNLDVSNTSQKLARVFTPHRSSPRGIPRSHLLHQSRSPKDSISISPRGVTRIKLKDIHSKIWSLESDKESLDLKKLIRDIVATYPEQLQAVIISFKKLRRLMYEKLSLDSQEKGATVFHRLDSVKRMMMMTRGQLQSWLKSTLPECDIFLQMIEKKIEMAKDAYKKKSYYLAKKNFLSAQEKLDEYLEGKTDITDEEHEKIKLKLADIYYNLALIYLELGDDDKLDEIKELFTKSAKIIKPIILVINSNIKAKTKLKNQFFDEIKSEGELKRQLQKRIKNIRRQKELIEEKTHAKSPSPNDI